MKKYLIVSSLFISVLLLLTSCSTMEKNQMVPEKGTLKVGWGKRSIAMPGPVPIAGQFHLRVSHGVFTPVEASALVLEDSRDAVIFVSCDVVSVNPKILVKVRELLKKEVPGLPVEKIILNATHTHAGPSTGDNVINYPNKVKIVPGSKVQEFLSRQIADAVKEAWQKRSSGSIAYGYGFATVGHSRRAVYLRDMGKKAKTASGTTVNGHAIMYGNTNNVDFASYEAGTDAFINLLYTFDSKGKLTGAVINVPCPSQTNEGAWALHASFWHNVREKLQAKYGKVGIIAQSAAAGDLSPRQLHYNNAEIRRYMLKYADKIRAYIKNPMPLPGKMSNAVAPDSYDVIELMRAEDIANRIVGAFEEVLSWAGKEKFSSPVLRHEVKTVKLARRTYPKALMEEEKEKYKAAMKEKFLTKGDKWQMLKHNSRLYSRRARLARIESRYTLQKTDPSVKTRIHAVRVGDIAFTTNRFELYLDFQHRIQARSPFEQTFIVQLVTDPWGTGSYLSTLRGERNKGYGSTPHSNVVSYKGGQQLVNKTVEMLEDLGRVGEIIKNPAQVTVPRIKGAPTEKDWKRAPLLKNFCDVRVNGSARAATEIRLLHNGKELFVKAVCSKAEKGDDLVLPPATFPKRDGAVWSYECVEFFLANGKETRQILFSANDTLADFFYSPAFKDSPKSWNGKKTRFKSRITATGWEGLLVLSLDELEFASGKKGEYKFNIVRTNMYRTRIGRSQRQAGAYLFPNSNYRDVTRYGTLKLAE